MKQGKSYATDPNAMLDALIKTLGLKNDAALSRALKVAPPVISKIRHYRLPVGASFTIKALELVDLPYSQAKEKLGLA